MFYVIGMMDKNITKFIKDNLKVEFTIDSYDSDEPGYYGDNATVRACVKIFVKDELIYEDTASEVVYR